MITIFNRREIGVTRDQTMLSRIQSILAKNGIGYTTRTNSATNPGRSHGIPFVDAEHAYECRIYVHRRDYEKAKTILK